MTTINLMATGAFYACGRDEKQCRDYLEHLENDKPMLALVENKNAEYGVVIDVMEESRKVASIGRLDIGTALSAMRLENEETLMADVESVCYDGKYFTLKVDLENEVENSIYTACDWSRWEPLDLPMLSPSPKVQSVCSASKVLKSLMKKGRKENAVMMMPYLKTLTENCRCDVTKETQDALRMTRGYLEQCKDKELRNYAREVVHAINGLGSQKREEEYEVYWTELTESNEALVMMNQWMMLQRTDGTDEMMIEVIDKQIEAIDDNLRQLPNRLYFSINDPAKLLHLLVYAYIPRNKWQALMTELVLKEMLRQAPQPPKGERTEASPQPSPKGEGALEGAQEAEDEGAGPHAHSRWQNQRSDSRTRDEGLQGLLQNQRSDSRTRDEGLQGLLQNKGQGPQDEEQRIAQAIDQTHARMRLHKKEFRIIHKILKEQYDKSLSMQNFERFVKMHCTFSKDEMPSWNNIKQLPLMANTTYPEWKFYDTPPAKVERYMDVAATFLEFLA